MHGASTEHLNLRAPTWRSTEDDRGRQTRTGEGLGLVSSGDTRWPSSVGCGGAWSAYVQSGPLHNAQTEMTDCLHTRTTEQRIT